MPKFFLRGSVIGRKKLERILFTNLWKLCDFSLVKFGQNCTEKNCKTNLYIYLKNSTYFLKNILCVYYETELILLQVRALICGRTVFWGWFVLFFRKKKLDWPVFSNENLFEEMPMWFLWMVKFFKNNITCTLYIVHYLAILNANVN